MKKMLLSVATGVSVCILQSVFVMVMVVSMLAGCGFAHQLEDGYQFGDVARGTISDLSELCDPNDPARRVAARAAYRAATGSPFPIPVCDIYNAEEPTGDETQNPF